MRNLFSAISSGTERARIELSQKSLLGKARARPDLVREVFDRAQRDGVRTTMHTVYRRLGEETAVGYSSSGTVVEVGEHVRGLHAGDPVACAGSAANHAEFVALPANLCVPIPRGVPLECAAITTIAAIAMHGIRLADTRVGSRVAVIGCGLVGQIALRLLRAAGAEAFALDINDQRVAQARSAGADHAFSIDASTEERVWAQTDAIGVDEVLITAAAQTSEPLLLAANIARKRGTLVLVGAVPISFPRTPLYEKELRFRVSRSYGAGRYDHEYEERGLDYPIEYVRWTEKRNMESVLRLQAQHLVSFSDLLEILPVEQAADAYARLAGSPERQPRGAIVLSYDNASARATNGRPSPGTVKHVNSGREQAEHQPANTRNTAPSPVRVGLIGPGGFAGRVLIPALQASGAALLVVGGGLGPSAAAAARRGPFARTAPDESAVIADPEVDAVVISTRHQSHAALTAQALTANKHVLCEKPLALTAEELDSVMKAAASTTATLLVGFNRRFSSPLREMRSFLAAPGAPLTLSYRVSAGKLAPDHWTADLTNGGGRALGECCHFLDSVSFLADSPITEVHATGHGPASRPLQAYDNLIVNLRLADRGLASVMYVADGSSRVRKERIEGFCGTRTAILDDYAALDLFDARSHRRRRLKVPDKGHRREVAAFLTSASSGMPAISLSQIENITLATLAIVESLRTGRTVRLAR